MARVRSRGAGEGRKIRRQHDVGEGEPSATNMRGLLQVDSFARRRLRGKAVSQAQTKLDKVVALCLTKSKRKGDRVKKKKKREREREKEPRFAVIHSERKRMQ